MTRRELNSRLQAGTPGSTTLHLRTRAASPKAGQRVLVLRPQRKGQPPGEPLPSALLEEASKAKPRFPKNKAEDRPDLKTPHPIPTLGSKPQFRGTACTRALEAPGAREQEGGTETTVSNPPLESQLG